jgi:dihydrolipoamide dehydrogenase
MAQGNNVKDIVIIGGGPGGYVAAIRAGQLGKSVTVVERDKVGGTCLNYGCIPSKGLLSITDYYSKIQKAGKWGIDVGNVAVDLSKMMDWKDEMVKGVVGGVHLLFKGNRVELLKGEGEIVKPGEVAVRNNGESQVIQAQSIIVATGSVPIQLPHIPFNHKEVIDSTDALDLREIPKTFGVIGGGYVGLEIATVFNRLGSKVTVIELQDTILPGMELELSKQALRSLKKQGMEILLNTKVEQADITADGRVELVMTGTEGGSEEKRMNFDKVLVSVGRKALSRKAGLEKLSLQLDNGQNIRVNERLETGIPGIYAIGDVAGHQQLAHKASREGTILVEALSGHSSTMSWRVVPYCVFIEPELAGVGMTEEEAKGAGHEVKVGRFPFRASGRARSVDETEGMVKVIADQETDDLLGVHIFGSHASEMIAEAAVAMEMEATAEDLASTIHVHPTFSESVMEAALNVNRQAIHIVNKKG